MPIGIEVLETRFVAVLLEGGAVSSRIAGNFDGDPAGAVRAALDRLTPAASAQIGIAAIAPESPAAAAVVSSLGVASGSVVSGSIVPSGVAAAVAECWIGAAKGSQDAVYLAVAEHTTGGVIRDGVPLRGAHGRAGAVAWLALNPVEREDYRKIGCLEAEAAASGIVRRLIWRIKAGDPSQAQEAAGGDMASMTIEHVFAAARAGDGVAISVIRDTAKFLAMAAANVVALADPEALVLGGFIASAADLLFEPLRADLDRRLPRAMTDALTIVPASLGEDAPAIGAARLAATEPR